MPVSMVHGNIVSKVSCCFGRNGHNATLAAFAIHSDVGIVTFDRNIRDAQAQNFCKPRRAVVNNVIMVRSLTPILVLGGCLSMAVIASS